MARDPVFDGYCQVDVLAALVKLVHNAYINCGCDACPFDLILFYSLTECTSLANLNHLIYAHF